MGTPIIAQLFKELRPSTSFDKDIQAAFDSLKQTNDLIERLRIDLAERYRKLADVKEKYETYSKLASTEKSQADAILEVVEKQAHHERYVNIAASAVTGIVIF